jgi:hypothetical protein
VVVKVGPLIEKVNCVLCVVVFAVMPVNVVRWSSVVVGFTLPIGFLFDTEIVAPCAAEAFFLGMNRRCGTIHERPHQSPPPL